MITFREGKGIFNVCIRWRGGYVRGLYVYLLGLRFYRFWSAS